MAGLPCHLGSTQSQGGQQDNKNDVDRPESPTSLTNRLDTAEPSGPLNSLDTGLLQPAGLIPQPLSPDSVTHLSLPPAGLTHQPLSPPGLVYLPAASITATEDSEPSSTPDADTAGPSPCRRAYIPKKKRKVIKLQKAEEAADSVVAKVLADQSKRREEQLKLKESD